MTGTTRYTLPTAATLITALLLILRLAGSAEARNNVPGRPTGLTAAAADHDTVELAWTAPETGGAVDHYRIFRRNMDDPGSRLTRAGTARTTSHTDGGLEAGTRYAYRVSAAGTGDRQSRRSQRATVTTQEAIPVQVRSVAGSQESGNDPVTVTWSAPDGATKYQVERERVPAPAEDRDTFDIDTAATSYQDTATEYNTKYSYRVRAGNGAGYGPWSAGVRITTQRKPGTPDKPTNLSLEQPAGTTTVVITWEPPTGDETVDGYSVRRRTVEDGTETEVAAPDGGVTSHTDDTVDRDTWYTYRVHARNTAGTGPDSTWQSIHVQNVESSTPEAPEDLELSEETPGEVVISWDPPEEGPEPTGYRIYRQTIGETAMELLATVQAPATTHTDATVEPEALYGYRVTAANQVNEGPYEGPEAITTRVQTPGVPHQPTGVRLSEETAGEVVITWNAPSGGPSPTGYRVYRKRLSSGGDRSVTLIGSTGQDATSYTDTTVAGEVLYEYRVRAANGAGENGAAGPRAITTKAQNSGAPDAPDETEAEQ